MLVLSRTTRQQLVIDGQITITILEIKGRRARIGIEAPDSVRIIRGELAFDPPAGADKPLGDTVGESLPPASQPETVAPPAGLAPRSPQSARTSRVTSEWSVPGEPTGNEGSPTARPEEAAGRRSPLSARVARRHAVARLAAPAGVRLEAIPQAVAV